MIRIGITQRVAENEAYSERRDCLDQRWADFIVQVGGIMVPLPNGIKANPIDYLEALDLDAFILSGGNTLAHLAPRAKDTAPERDEFETTLIKYAQDNGIPILGVCRGMQMINHFFGGSMIRVKNHVANRHPIEARLGNFSLPANVNSFHDWGISKQGLADNLNISAVDNNGSVEAFEDSSAKIYGIMWHPEREQPFNQLDIKFVKGIFI